MKLDMFLFQDYIFFSILIFNVQIFDFSHLFNLHRINSIRNEQNLCQSIGNFAINIKNLAKSNIVSLC